eukprot:1676679-Rhodomonas_salina.1
MRCSLGLHREPRCAASAGNAQQLAQRRFEEREAFSGGRGFFRFRAPLLQDADRAEDDRARGRTGRSASDLSRSPSALSKVTTCPCRSVITIDTAMRSVSASSEQRPSALPRMRGQLMRHPSGFDAPLLSGKRKHCGNVDDWLPGMGMWHQCFRRGQRARALS